MRKRKGPKRTALSQRNILEFEAAECKRIKALNRQMRVKTLRTNPALLQTVIIIPPQRQTNGNP